MINVNIVQAGDLQEIQVLVRAHEYCMTEMPVGNKAPRIFCVANDSYLFLTELMKEEFVATTNIENINKEGEGRITLVVFQFGPVILPHSIIKSMWPEEDPLKKHLLKNQSGDYEVSVHFDFAFAPPLRDREKFFKKCREVGEVEFLFCKPIKYWERAGEPVILANNRLNARKLATPDRLAKKVGPDSYLVG